MLPTLPENTSLKHLSRKSLALRQPLAQFSGGLENPYLLKESHSGFASRGADLRQGKRSSIKGSNHQFLADLELQSLGNYLDKCFRLMTFDILNEVNLSFMQLESQGCLWEGLSYQDRCYRLVETFEPTYRLKAYCMAQHFAEGGQHYVMTASSLRFAIWIAIETYD